MSEDACINCKFFDKDEYECHRFPPQIQWKKRGTQRSMMAQWPSVSSIAWCGEYQRGQGA